MKVRVTLHVSLTSGQAPLESEFIRFPHIILSHSRIRAWLGHVSINTTNIYAETDLEMRAKALATCEVKETKRSRRWKEDKVPNDVPARALSLELMWRSVRWFVAES